MGAPRYGEAGRKKRDSYIWDKDPLNWYVEEPWCNARLFEEEFFEGGIHDPCCGSGQIVKAAFSAGYDTTCSDVKRRVLKPRHTKKALDGFGFTLQDYTTDTRTFDNIVTNPPFDPCNKPPFPFVEWALAHAQRKVALILPLKWLAGDKRSRWLETKPLKRVYVLTPRPSMPPGEYLLAGNVAEGGKKDFAWFIFDHAYNPYAPPELRWLHREGVSHGASKEG